jgi:hypothetical protein
MDFLFKKNHVVIESEKKTIELNTDNVDLDGLPIDVAGEYEKSGFLAYGHEQEWRRIYQIRVEGETIGYISHLTADLSTEELEFFGDLDILVAPTAKSSLPLLEKIEPRMLITYGETAHELATALWVSEFPVTKYKVKEADMSLEKMGVLLMGE